LTSPQQAWHAEASPTFEVETDCQFGFARGYLPFTDSIQFNFSKNFLMQ